MRDIPENCAAEEESEIKKFTKFMGYEGYTHPHFLDWGTLPPLLKNANQYFIITSIKKMVCLYYHKN